MHFCLFVYFPSPPPPVRKMYMSYSSERKRHRHACKWDFFGRLLKCRLLNLRKEEACLAPLR